MFFLTVILYVPTPIAPSYIKHDEIDATLLRTRQSQVRASLGQLSIDRKIFRSHAASGETFFKARTYAFPRQGRQLADRADSASRLIQSD